MQAIIRPSPRLLASISHTQHIASLAAASSSSSSSSSPSRLKKKKPTLSLDQFIQRQRVLHLWREIVRAVNKIPPSSTRDELRTYARQEFERNRGVSDLTHIRYLISSGKAEFDTMKRYIDEQAASAAAAGR